MDPFPTYISQPRKLADADGAKTISEAKLNLSINFWQQCIDGNGAHVFVAWNDLSRVGHRHGRWMERQGLARYDNRFGGWFVSFDKWAFETMSTEDLRKIFETYRDKLAQFIAG